MLVTVDFDTSYPLCHNEFNRILRRRHRTISQIERIYFMLHSHPSNTPLWTQLNQWKNSDELPTYEQFESMIDTRWQAIYETSDPSFIPSPESFFGYELNEVFLDHTLLIQSIVTTHRLESNFELSNLMKLTHHMRDLCTIATAKPKRAHALYLVDGSDETYVIGDLHSDIDSLKALLQRTSFFERTKNNLPFRLVFMGDYVDRGAEHLAILDWIFSLKFLYSEHILLLRGNHDGGYIENNGSVITPYRVPEEDHPLWYFPLFIRALEHENPSVIEDILPMYLYFFESLAYGAIVTHPVSNRVAFCCHGGILRPNLTTRALTENDPLEVLLKTEEWSSPLWQPMHLWYQSFKTLAAMTEQDAFDAAHRSNRQQMMWSDPTEQLENMRWHQGRFKFTEDHFIAYKDHFDFDLLFRGHQVAQSGVQSYYHEQLFTVFSTGGKLSVQSKINLKSAYQEVTPAIVHLENQLSSVGVIDI